MLPATAQAVQASSPDIMLGDPRRRSAPTAPSAWSRWCPSPGRRTRPPSNSCTTCGTRRRRSVRRWARPLAVTGLTAAAIDVSDKLADALPVYLLIVVGLALVLLLLIFRSIVVPVVAALGFLLTIGVSFGAVVAVYQWGWLSAIFGVDTPAPIISFLPILLIGVLFGLAMDYQVFMVSGMREAYVHGADAKRAVVSGFTAGSRVVTAAGIIMASVFAGFILAPDTIIASIGFALAIGVLVDAFIVRMTLTPAVMTLLGKVAWYLPRWLDKVLPNVDIEGEKLLASLNSGVGIGAPRPAPAASVASVDGAGASADGAPDRAGASAQAPVDGGVSSGGVSNGASLERRFVERRFVERRSLEGGSLQRRCVERRYLERRCVERRDPHRQAPRRAPRTAGRSTAGRSLNRPWRSASLQARASTAPDRTRSPHPEPVPAARTRSPHPHRTRTSIRRNRTFHLRFESRYRRIDLRSHRRLRSSSCPPTCQRSSRPPSASIRAASTGCDWSAGPVFDLAVELSGAAGTPKVCFIGTATGDNPAYRECYSALADRFRPTHLELFPMPNLDDIRGHLLAQDVIWVGGGAWPSCWRCGGCTAGTSSCGRRGRPASCSPGCPPGRSAGTWAAPPTPSAPSSAR